MMEGKWGERVKEGDGNWIDRVNNYLYPLKIINMIAMNIRPLFLLSASLSFATFIRAQDTQQQGDDPWKEGLSCHRHQIR